MDVLFCIPLNDVGVLVVPPKKELVFVAVANPPRLFPNVAVLPNTDVELLLVFPNIDDVLFEEVNPPPPNGLLFCTANVLFPNTLLVDVLVLTRPK